MCPIPDGLCDEQGMIFIHLTPRARQDKIEGLQSDNEGKQWLKVKITSVPEDGKANKALLKFLAKTWKIPASALTLESGASSRHKRIRYIPKG